MKNITFTTPQQDHQLVMAFLVFGFFLVLAIYPITYVEHHPLDPKWNALFTNPIPPENYAPGTELVPLWDYGHYRVAKWSLWNIPVLLVVALGGAAILRQSRDTAPIRGWASPAPKRDGHDSPPGPSG